MRYGLIGWPLGHSISPQLHRRLAGVEYDLRPLPEAEFERFMRERDFSAVNVTIPYKRRVLPYCAQMTPAARRCGSVNLLIKGRDGTLTGDNTDLAGLEFLLRQNGWVLTGQTVVILGSGGTGHMAKAAAKELGAAEIATVSRTGELNYENLAKRFGKRDFYLINTTPVGMMPQSGVSPLDLRQFSRCKPAGGGTGHPRVRRAADAGGPGRCCRVRLWDGGAGRRNGAAGLPGATGRTAEPGVHRDAGQRKDHHRAAGRPDAGAGVYRLR